MSRQGVAARTGALADRVDPADRNDRFPARPSGGRRQRIAMARALAMNPKGMHIGAVTSAPGPEPVGEALQVILGPGREHEADMLTVDLRPGPAGGFADRPCSLDGWPSGKEANARHPRNPRTQAARPFPPVAQEG